MPNGVSALSLWGVSCVPLGVSGKLNGTHCDTPLHVRKSVNYEKRHPLTPSLPTPSDTPMTFPVSLSAKQTEGELTYYEKRNAHPPSSSLGLVHLFINLCAYELSCFLCSITPHTSTTSPYFFIFCAFFSISYNK